MRSALATIVTAVALMAGIPEVGAQTIAGWGSTGFGNIDDIANNIVKVSARADNTLVLKSDGTVASWGLNHVGQCNIPASLGTVTSISAGVYHAVALKSDGTVVCWGWNGSGQCDVPASLGTVTSISAGGSHTVAVKTNGTVACWGSNGSGECNVPASLGTVTSIAAGGLHTVAIKTNGAVVCWGLNSDGQCNVPASLGTVTAIAAGGSHTVALKSDGTVACWGLNSAGQCNIPASLGTVTSISAGSSHTVALKPDGTFVCWGSGTSGQCNVPISLGKVMSVAGGVNYTVALKSDGTVVCWGRNDSGQGDVPASLGTVTAIAAGYFHVVALKSGGTVACWGWNASGQCNVPASLGTVTAIAAGGSHTVARKSDGIVACWGSNLYGQCSVPVSLGAVTSIAAGDDHTHAIKSDGTVGSWGSNDNGQCTVPASVGTVTTIAAGGDHVAAIKSNGTVACWGSNLYGQCSVPASLGSVRNVAAGRAHTVALKSDGTVAGWGFVSGLSPPPNLGPVVAIASGHEHIVARICSAPSIDRDSGNLGAIGAGMPREFTFDALPPVAGPATLTVRVRADLDLSTEYLTLVLDGVTQSNALFLDGGSDCPSVADSAVVTIPATQLAALLADGTLTVRLEASPLVSATQCSSGLCEIRLQYEATSIDCNGNGVADHCEIASGAGDTDDDGVIDDCEIAQGDFDLDGVVSANDLAVVLSYWNVANGPLGDLNGDGVVGADDLAILLGNWGALPSWFAPRIASVTPNSGPIVGGTAITITGVDLTAASAVTIGGVAATSVNVVNSTTVTAVTPAGTAGAKTVSVTTPAGTGSLAGGFTYVAGPTVASVTPNSGPIIGGTAITITGVDLTAASAVAIGGVAATSVNVVNSTTVTAVTPAGTAGAKTVSVTTPAGTGSLAGGFTYVVGPTPASITPNSGPTTGGTVITMTGANLAGTTAVTIGGVPATSFSVVDSTTVTAVTPAGSVGAKNVMIFTPGGNATFIGGFTYLTYPSWGTVLDGLPNPAIVTNATLRSAILATGYPWRVRDNGTNIEMLLIPPGTFNMGCSASNGWGCYSEENPVHSVTLTSAFYLGRYEVTQAQWTAKMGSNPSSFQSASAQVPAAQVPNRPVEQVSWTMVQGFLSATGMRLPTEAEWEYACRAGTTTAFHSMPGYPNGTNDDTQAGNIAWFALNSSAQTHPVGGKAANGYGLYDMSGNVWEWVSDWFSGTYYASSPSTNPQGPASGTTRTMRSGAWAFNEDVLRSSERSGTAPDSQSLRIGFRVARPPL